MLVAAGSGCSMAALDLISAMSRSNFNVRERELESLICLRVRRETRKSHQPKMLSTLVSYITSRKFGWSYFL